MENSGNSPSRISSEVEITGTIKTSGNIQIDGRLSGDLDCGGDATIGKSAAIKGNLTVSSVSVAGSITGNIVAKDRIEMKSSAKVQGDIQAKRLAVEDGVSFVGKSEVNPSGGPASASTPPPASGDEGGKEGLFGKKG